jgi:hypothetical protein
MSGGLARGDSQPTYAVSVLVLGVSRKKLAVRYPAMRALLPTQVTGIRALVNPRLRLGGLSETNPDVTLLGVPLAPSRLAVQNVPAIG